MAFSNQLKAPRNGALYYLNLPEQIHARLISRQFLSGRMVCGQDGGRSSFLP